MNPLKKIISIYERKSDLFRPWSRRARIGAIGWSWSRRARIGAIGGSWSRRARKGAVGWSGHSLIEVI